MSRLVPLPVDRRDVEEMVASLRGCSARSAGPAAVPRADVKALVDVALSRSEARDRVRRPARRARSQSGRRAREREQGAVAVDSLVRAPER